MTHRVLSAVEALQLGLIEEVCHGVANAQQRAWHVADARAEPSMAMIADPGILVREASGHAECRLVNGGEVKSSISDAMDVAVLNGMKWSSRRDMQPMQHHMCASPPLFHQHRLGRPVTSSEARAAELRALASSELRDACGRKTERRARDPEKSLKSMARAVRRRLAATAE